MAASVQIQQVWSDLDHCLIQDGQGQLKKVINVQAVMSSIDNILRTYRGERVMLPQFASGLRGMVFESIGDTLLKYLSREIREMITLWDSRVTVTSIEISSDPDQQFIQVTVTFVIKGYGEIFRYETPIKGD